MKTDVKPQKISFFSSTEHHKHGSGRIIGFYTLFLTLAFFIASACALFYTNDHGVIDGLVRILTSPSKLVTDYFALGGLSAAFLNTALCGTLANIVMCLSIKRTTATTFAAYMLVVAHGFYGLNCLNMITPILGVLIYCAATRRSLAENVHIALFSTALGPFISDFVFRYANDSFDPANPKASILGIILAVLFGIAAGFVVPALIPETTKMHRGFNMYKAGLAIGIMGIFVYSFMYRTLGIDAPEVIEITNDAYYALPYGYRGFVNTFFIALFALTIALGFFLNGRSFHGYRQLIRSTGYGVDFVDKFGMPVCLINIGIYGLCAIAYLNIIFILPEIFPFLPQGVGFTGATVGVVFAALTFAADGQQPRTIAPIVLGYVLLLAVVCAICSIIGIDIPWTLSTQGYINGLAFATGLCPFSGKYGWKVGVLAGFLSAVICTSTSAMHGGFVLYNGGFNAGLTALVLLPILDFYKVKTKFEDDK
ncbi:MAG: DUF1576 domain-containing protein [Clostridia bacterium]|nr:DUF1576 domain-containing protein [Clostridia bacterium]